MYLIVGLGNPGKKYERTRHNIGWLVLDELARRWNIDIARKQHKAETGSGIVKGHAALLAKPQTFMNLSGEAVSALARYNRVAPENLIVVCDDLNLPAGKLRLRAGGSDGGQNGLKSVMQHLGHQNWARLRFGIGEPPREDRLQRGTADYVLTPFAADEWPLVEKAVARAADCLETFVANGLQDAMNQYNRAE
ncbi:MAG TPA: aminoacyl-tRNA hydrolase [Abditibacteriaceae bacterium]|jgi:PTH1 family peptidyl-tRNA hydrolase